MIKKFQPYLAGLILALLFFILGVITLSDYGISWDAAFRMMRGQDYAHLYLDGKLNYDHPNRISPVLIKPGQKITKYINSAWEGNKQAQLPDRPLPQTDFKKSQSEANLKTSFYEDQDWDGSYMIHEGTGHLPLIDTLSAFSNKFFYQTLGLLGDIESYQLIYILAAAIGVFVVTVFTFQITGSQSAAVIAGFSLSLFPLFLGDSHINMKDPIQASFYAGAIWSFWNWVRTNQLRWFVIFTTFVSFALGVKWNIIFLPLVFLPWLLSILKTPELKRWFRVKKLLCLFALLLVTCILFMILIWPNSWANPINSLISLVQFYWSRGTDPVNQPGGFIGLLGLNFYPVILFLTQTPEIIMVLSLIAICLSGLAKFKNDHLKTSLLVCLWVFEPLIRYSLPGVATLLGLRQIMEILPGLAVLSGIGSWYLIKVISNKLGSNKQSFFRNKLFVELSLLLITYLLLLIPIIRLHPNENSYFNTLSGGLNGATRNNLVDWTLTYGNVYKQAAVWLNQNAQPNADLALLDGSNFALSPLWLRSDISFSPNHFSGFDQKGEYLFIPLDSSNFPVFANRYPLRFLKPIYQVQVDGVPILKIYKNSPEFVKDGYQNEQQVHDATVTPNIVYGQKILELNFQKQLLITRILISGADQKCLKTVINDIFIFQPTYEITTNDIDNKVLYATAEPKILSDGQIQYSFPGEKSQYLSILLGQENSCFEQAKISKVFALDN